jgi:serine/threonine-protein kinase OSR1/STK39
MKVLMLTLQNEPPELDSGAVEKGQFKEYGSVFRKFINACLQKNPARRPTATELLKHPFITRKAQNKRFLQITLLPSAPSLKDRVFKLKQEKRQAGASGRMYKTENNTWEWSSGSDEDEEASARAEEVSDYNGTKEIRTSNRSRQVE